MSSFEACIGAAADNVALQRLFATPQPSSGIQIAFERAPDYFASAAVMYQQSHLLLIRHKAQQKLAAAVNMGQRQSYINGQQTLLRYGADMRIAPEFRGGRVLAYVNRAVKETVRDGWYLTVILQDNQRSQQSLEGGRAGLPFYRHLGDITTYSVTRSLLRGTQPAHLTIRTAARADIATMNAWVQQMAGHYQFLPCYDFNSLLTQNAFYHGLQLSDFLLLERDGQLAGLVGLWDQHQLKQARVVCYNLALRLVRPLYNLWSRLVGGLILPPVGQHFSYLSLHSPLTHPDDTEGFAWLLNAALRQAHQRGFNGMALTLADNDPRQQAMPHFKSITIKAKQYSVAYNEADQPVLHPHFIHYHDAGRL